MLIIPSSWGSQRALHQQRHQAFFWASCIEPSSDFLAPLPGNKEKEAPTSTTCLQRFSSAVAGESRTSSQGESLITNLFTLLFLFCLAFFLLCLLVLFFKNPKKISSTCFAFLFENTKKLVPILSCHYVTRGNNSHF